MKLGLTRRKTDLDDQEILFDALIADVKPNSVEELWSWVKKYVPKERLEVARASMNDLWSKQHD